MILVYQFTQQSRTMLNDLSLQLLTYQRIILGKMLQKEWALHFYFYFSDSKYSNHPSFLAAQLLLRTLYLSFLREKNMFSLLCPKNVIWPLTILGFDHCSLELWAVDCTEGFFCQAVILSLLMFLVLVEIEYMKNMMPLSLRIPQECSRTLC